MKIGKSILAANLGLLLAAFSGMAVAGPSSQKQPSPTTAKQAVPKSNSKSLSGVSQGTITSIDSDRLVLSHKEKNGKVEEMTFMLGPKTERKGDLTSGAQVSVHYQNENNQLMATVIQAMSQKTASSAKKLSTKK